METLASGSIDLKSLKIASEEANQYITTIDGGGIKVHDSGNINDYIQITSSGVDIYKYNGIDNSEKVASFASDKTTIGKTENTRVEIDYRSIQLKDREQNTYFWVSDLRDENGDYEKTDTFKGDGYETFFTLNNTAKNTNYVVTVNGDIVTPSQIYTTVFCIEPAPRKGATIVAEYITQDTNLKAFTFGSRRTNNFNHIGIMSFAEGDHIHASGNISHAEGSYTIASGNSSHAEGYHTTASGEFTHSEGLNSDAKKIGSHAEGSETTADGIYSHAEGNLSETTGESSHAEGYQTTASGYTSHAEGKDTTASGYASHAQNRKTIAASESQTALGKFNEEDNADTYALIIGNGTADDARSNALTVDWNGNIIAQGMAGMVQMFAGSTAPTGWLLCDGEQYLKTEYPELYAAILDAYGDTTKGWVAPTDSDHFRVPDLRGRFPLGVGNGTASGHTAHALASGSGAEKVTLAADNMPYHRHALGQLTTETYAGFKPSLQVANVATGSQSTSDNPLTYAGANRGTSSKNNDYTGASNTGGSHSHKLTAGQYTNYAGGSNGAATAHDNMPPFISMNFIIATGKTS